MVVSGVGDELRLCRAHRVKRNEISRLPRSVPELGGSWACRSWASVPTLPTTWSATRIWPRLGYDADWIVQRTGILERRHAPPGIATSDMAVEAAEECIEDAGVDPADIDLVLLGTFTPDLLLPATACLVQDRLGLLRPAMDLQAACASFIYAHDHRDAVRGHRLQQAGAGDRGRLQLAGGQPGRRADLSAVRRRGRGGAAGAGDDSQGLLAYAVGSDGSGADLLCREWAARGCPSRRDADANGSHFLTMEGRPIFKWAVRIVAADDRRGPRRRPHDARRRRPGDLPPGQHADHQLGGQGPGHRPGKVFNNLDRYGNTSAASIPLALDEAYREGRIHRGDRILFSGFGAGLAWGTVLMQW